MDEAKILEYKMMLNMIDFVKRIAKVIYGDVNLFTMAKTIKYLTGVSEYAAYAGALAIEALEDIITYRLERIENRLLDIFEEESNYWGE